MSLSTESYYIGVDVGTGSVRVGIVSCDGKIVSTSVQPIQMWTPKPSYYEQSSENIWMQVCKAVKSSLIDAGIPPKLVRGIGFDATASLVVIDKNDQPLAVSPSGNPQQNIIVWMDHRAIGQSEWINELTDDCVQEVLQYVGGRISPEMQLPKVLWLKQNNHDTWSRAALCLDLVDFLTYKATGINVRSTCGVTCKWTYREKNGGWSSPFFKKINMEEQLKKTISGTISTIGSRIGKGLTKLSANDLGLEENTVVAVGLIDAHSGGIGMLGAELPGSLRQIPIYERMALICGTSSCHMILTKQPHFVPGVWGPYYSAMVPGYWLLEGGQSSSGSLLDHLVKSHSAFSELQAYATKNHRNIYQELNHYVYNLAKKRDCSFISILTRKIHILPYFHGNRSPRADPSLVGTICGLTLNDSSLDGLAIHYLAAVQALADRKSVV